MTLEELHKFLFMGFLLTYIGSLVLIGSEIISWGYHTYNIYAPVISIIMASVFYSLKK